MLYICFSCLNWAKRAKDTILYLPQMESCIHKEGKHKMHKNISEGKEKKEKKWALNKEKKKDKTWMSKKYNFSIHRQQNEKSGNKLYTQTILI